jgi:hypothetical protein
MALIDYIQCGKVIIFNSMLLKLRWAFCIDFNRNQQIIYRGIFGLKTLDKKTFLGFARIVDIFDYIDRPLHVSETARLKSIYKTSNLMNDCKNVKDFISKLYKLANIDFFVNPDNGWTLNGLKKPDRET